MVSKRTFNALVLVFIGTKMLIIDLYKIPVGVALGVTATLIAGSMFASFYSTRSAKKGE